MPRTTAHGRGVPSRSDKSPKLHNCLSSAVQYHCRGVHSTSRHPAEDSAEPAPVPGHTALLSTNTLPAGQVPCSTALDAAAQHRGPQHLPVPVSCTPASLPAAHTAGRYTKQEQKEVAAEISSHVVLPSLGKLPYSGGKWEDISKLTKILKN